MDHVVYDGWQTTCPHCGETMLCKITAGINAVWQEEKEVTVAVEAECAECGQLLSDQTATIEFWDLKHPDPDTDTEAEGLS